MRTLVIVESPAKARTIGKFLGRGYSVKASVGHVRDLPRSQFGVEVDNDFEPKWITIRGKGETLKELREAARKAERVLLATDPDREGEAISWHLAQVLKLDEDAPLRIEFHEVTRQAVQKALKAPRPVDDDLVAAYQARRILDRIVGYKLSPLLWSKVKPGLSAGRVQSVAVRLICDREREIEAFVPQEYWSITAHLRPLAEGDGPAGMDEGGFAARLTHRGKQKIEIPDEETARSIVIDLTGASFRVEKVARRQRRKNPAAPFTTSTLQQEASRRLGFSASKTMRLAQQLYEGMDIGPGGPVGLVTYVRTDATRVSQEAQEEARALIESVYGPAFRPERPPEYKTRAAAQAAHEAIRPTSVQRTPDGIKEYLKRDHHRLYRLIWERFVASQMSPAVLDTVSVDVSAGPYVFRASGSTVTFPGFMTLYSEQTEEAADEEATRLPELNEGQRLTPREIVPRQHFTQPPPRYSEAMLVKTLEELGIGRPSTYHDIIETIQRRGYVILADRRFQATELGFLVVDLLKEHFPEIMDIEFTATLERRLDEIEEGNVEWTQVLRDFHGPFAQALDQAHDQMEQVELAEEVSGEVCPECGRNLVVKWGRYGKFLACPGFPACRFTKPLLHEIGVPCPQCGQPVVERRSRRGRTFYGCAGYPECRFTSWERPVAAACPRCGRHMVERRRRGELVALACADRACGHVQQAAVAEEVAYPGRAR